MDKAGYQDMKIIFGEHSWWKAGVTFLENGLKACPELVNSNIIAAAHGYTLIGNTEFVQSPLCAENNIHIWNTETALQIHTILPGKMPCNGLLLSTIIWLFPI